MSFFQKATPVHLDNQAIMSICSPSFLHLHVLLTTIQQECDKGERKKIFCQIEVVVLCLLLLSCCGLVFCPMLGSLFPFPLFSYWFWHERHLESIEKPSVYEMNGFIFWLIILYQEKLSLKMKPLFLLPFLVYLGFLSLFLT